MGVLVVLEGGGVVFDAVALELGVGGGELVLGGVADVEVVVVVVEASVVGAENRACMEGVFVSITEVSKSGS